MLDEFKQILAKHSAQSTQIGKCWTIQLGGSPPVVVAHIQAIRNRKILTFGGFETKLSYQK
jgi:hypothetical protein